MIKIYFYIKYNNAYLVHKKCIFIIIIILKKKFFANAMNIPSKKA